MNRRNFLKLLGISPIIPSVLMAKENTAGVLTLAKLKEAKKFIDSQDEYEMYGKSPAIEEMEAYKKAMSDCMIYGQGTMKIEDGKWLHIKFTTENYGYGSSPMTIL